MGDNRAMSKQATLVTASCTFEIASNIVDGKIVPPTEFRLFPAGEFRAYDGRPQNLAAWVCNAKDAADIIAAFNDRGQPLLIDYDHSTITVKKTGGKALASGWATSLEWRDGSSGIDPEGGVGVPTAMAGLYATNVKWTPQAAEHIIAAEYRFISPVFQADKNGHVKNVLHSALTNDPALTGLTDLIAAYYSPQTTPIPTPIQGTSKMDELEERARWFLNLPVTATKADVIAALTKYIDMLNADDKTAATIKTDATYIALTTHLNKLVAASASPNPSEYAPIAAVAALQTELNAASAKLNELAARENAAKLEAVILSAKNSGKITSAASEAFARELGAKDPNTLSKYIETLTPIVQLNSTQTGGIAPSGAAGGNNTTDNIVASATAYQTEQAAKGITISDMDAVAHVTKTA